MLRLLNGLAIEIKVVFLVVLSLYLLHLLIISKTQMMNSVAKVKSLSTHVNSLNYFAKRVSREMEVSRYLIDNDSTLHHATFLFIHSLNSFFVNFIYI